MARDLMETQIIQGKEFIRERWNRLTEDDIRQINGRFDLLVDKLLQRYGYTREQAEAEIRKWNMERERKASFAPGKSYPRPEEQERISRKNEGSSLFKWLLAIGIPLALLALYFGSSDMTRATNTPPASYEQLYIAADTPADQSLAQSIRQAFRTNNIQLQDLSNIRLSASNGTVTVTGSVDTPQKRDAIVRTLQNIFGVRQVNNRIDIRQ